MFTILFLNQAAEFNFRNQLKTVKKKEFSMDEEEGAGVSLHDDDDGDRNEDDDDGAVYEEDGISILMFAIFWQNLNQFWAKNK